MQMIIFIFKKAHDKKFNRKTMFYLISELASVTDEGSISTNISLTELLESKNSAWHASAQAVGRVCVVGGLHRATDLLSDLFH